jgi:NAD(P)H dehydrogenase (quinone)
MIKAVVVYYSGYGHTKKQAEAVLKGMLDAKADAELISVNELNEASWEKMHAADAIVFGSPTYMGGVAADFKKFADASSSL